MTFWPPFWPPSASGPLSSSNSIVTHLGRGLAFRALLMWTHIAFRRFATAACHGNLLVTSVLSRPMSSPAALRSS